MPDPIKRRRRRRRGDSPSNIDDATELNYPSSPVGSGDISDQSTPRKRKRRTSTPDPIDNQPTLSISEELSDSDPNDNPDDPLILRSFAPINSNNINLIRADLQEDNNHSLLAESDFSDDTHDWGWDNPNISDDYWHFVGQYE